VSEVTRTLLRPWTDGGLWPALVHLATGTVVGPVLFTVSLTLLVATGSLLITFPLALPVAWLLFTTSRAMAHFERLRASTLLDLHLVDPVPPLERTNWFGRLAERAGSTVRWKEILHHLAMLPVGVAHGTIVLVVWTGSLLFVTLPMISGTLPGGTAKLGLFEVGPGLGSLVLAMIGVAGIVVVAPWTTWALAQLQRAFLRRLLGPSREVELGAAVDRLEQSRVAAVDTAESERRRIERDLHDGAQQRLVALAVTLGDAHERLATDPERGRELVADAHEEAKAALKELRDLVRGIHPVILEDRGLDAALSAVVARSAVPVDLRVEVTERPPPAVESAAYFIISEALANVAHHAGASRAWVSLVRSGDRLVVEVRDDGRGGADPSHGTGLVGLRNRVTAMAGSFHLSSPPGGPTTLLVELPCAS
jgi:signal transduction histidine kinase